MLKTVLYLSNIPGERRALLLKEGRPVDLLVERFCMQPFRHGLYLAQIEQWSPVLGGCFVSLGEAGRAFLPASGGASAAIKPGEKRIVAITCASYNGRPAQVSTQIALPSVRVVLVPGHNGIALSGRMRNKLTPAVELMLHHLRRADLSGIVLRETSLNAQPDVVVNEAKALHNMWQHVQQQAKASTAPGPLHLPHDLPMGQHMWSIADALAHGRIAVSQKETAQCLTTFWEELTPDLSDRIFVQEQFVVDNHVDQALETALSREIPFGSHGNLVFDENGTLNCIDVASFTPLKRGGRHGLNANLAAVSEIARLVRLKNLSGHIVVKFLCDEDEELSPAVLLDLRKAFADDPADVEVLGVMPQTSLVHVRRECFGPRLSEIYFDGNRPPILSFESVSVQLFRTLAEDIDQSPNNTFTVCAHPNYIAWLNARDQWRAMLPINSPDKLKWRPDATRDEREPFILCGTADTAKVKQLEKGIA